MSEKRPVRILVVDDNQPNRLLAKAVLKERVFDAFVQGAEETTSRSSRGLGLSFCKAAVEAHGGSIRVEDAAPGTVFCITISD